MAPSIDPTEARIAALERAIEDIRDAVVTIARLEERHAETREAISRCFQVSEKNAEAIVATNAAILVAKESSRERDTALRTEYESMRLQMERIEGQSKLDPATTESLHSTVASGTQTLPLCPVVQPKPTSTWQVAEHPSSAATLPSSHASAPPT